MSDRPRRGRRRLPRPQLTALQLTRLVSVGLILLYNAAFWAQVLEGRQLSGLHPVLFLASLFVFLVASLNILLSVVAFRYLQKPVTIGILLTAAPAAFFMNSYGVAIDSTMMQNVIETDPSEISGFLGLSLFLYILLLGVAPAILVAATRIVYRPFFAQLKRTAGSVLLGALLIVLVVPPFAKDHVSLFDKAHRLRYSLSPVNYLSATTKYLRQSISGASGPVRGIGTDAVRAARARRRRKRTLVILVVGETARAQQFSLNGYARQTNPQLGRQELVSFENVMACGTSTAISLPCMFSLQGREGFEARSARREEGLLDVLAHAGIDVLWRDNNSGCKGVCDRVRSQDVSMLRTPDRCSSGECYDEVLLSDLGDRLKPAGADTLIVLHQNGSHGPAYYLRYPREFERFTPVCRSSRFQSCTVQEVVNAYDNTILYTDHFLSRVIRFLEERGDAYDTAMLYLSDHGESLGEHHLYLHGLPYLIAPDVQKRVPFVVWLPAASAQALAIDRQCLQSHRTRRLSHDNLFHSVLGLMDVESETYDSSLDVFADCRLPREPAAYPSRIQQAKQAGRRPLDSTG
jgi:lipid A ethanolaminephosphotransferase